MSTDHYQPEEVIRIVANAMRMKLIDKKVFLQVFASIQSQRIPDAIIALKGAIGDTEMARLRHISVAVPDPDDSSIGFATEDPGYHVLTEAKQPSLPDTPVPPSRAAQLSGTRYRPVRILGKGGIGHVLAVTDVQAGRVVALKVLSEQARRRPEIVERFRAEGRITAQLEHPGIVPVYDLGLLPDGDPFYTMRVVERNSLAKIIDEPALRREFSIVRLASLFAQVCRAVHFAHQRGVVHRDIKPDNILIGEFGEVYVTDWGLSLVRPMDSDDPIPERKRLTGEGFILGTPGYMAPEQVTDPSIVDWRADVFSIGAVLYEILTGEYAFEAGDNHKRLLETLLVEPTPPHEMRKNVPLVLSDLCMRCLATDRNRRPNNLRAVAEEVEGFLEGTKERERQREAAAELVERAGQMSVTLAALQTEAERLETEAMDAIGSAAAFEDSQRKREGWELQGRAEQAELEIEEAFGDVISLYQDALRRDPANEEARAGLAELYYGRVLEAKTRRDERSRSFFQRLLKQYDDGTRAARLRAKAQIRLDSRPRGAKVHAHPFVYANRISTVGRPKKLGETPLEAGLPPGTWRLELSIDEGPSVLLPINVMPESEFEASVRFFSPEQITDGFIHIAAGRARIGGDHSAPNALPKTEVFVDDFAIARRPVTFEEYYGFLRTLDGEHAKERTPAIERLMAATGHSAAELPTRPLVGISLADALAYCAWLTERDGILVRLPTEAEWEKAARGADDRAFPWGDRFDPILCNARDSRALPRLEPVGAFTTDTSPYGVRDMAGGAREWVSSGVLRGGGWDGTAHECRCAARLRTSGDIKRIDAGLRLARSL